MKMYLLHVLALVSLIVSCSDSGAPVHFIVSDDFEGEIILRPNPDEDEIPMVNGHYEIIIPPSGVAEFKNLDPIRRWHTPLARRQSGDVIAWPGHVNHDVVSWHSGTTCSEGITRYFVGTLTNYYLYRGWDERIAELEKNTSNIDTDSLIDHK